MKKYIIFIFYFTAFSLVFLFLPFIIKYFEKQKSTLKITIGGDIMLSRSVGYFNKKANYDRITKKYNPIKKTNSDFYLFNLESPFSLFPKDTLERIFIFGADIRNGKELKNIFGEKNTLFSLANNHIRNAGKSGIKTTKKLLKKLGYFSSGVGKTTKKSYEFFSQKIKGLKLCQQSFTYDGGFYNGISVNKIKKEILLEVVGKMKKNNCDFKIISLHWGEEYIFEPQKWQKDLAHNLIDNGVDLVAGHHSHILGKVEIYKNKPIFYSLGNFIFDQDWGKIFIVKGGTKFFDEKYGKYTIPTYLGNIFEITLMKNKGIIGKINKNTFEIVKYGEFLERK